MVDIKLSRGITETLEILKHMDEMYTKKLPKSFIDFLQSNKDISYNPKFDCVQINDISRETKVLLGIMYLKYWSNEFQQKNFLHTLYQNQKKSQEELNKKYDLEKLFKKNRIYIESKEQENLHMIQYKENIFKKIIFKIKMFFKK